MSTPFVVSVLRVCVCVCMRVESFVVFSSYFLSMYFSRLSLVLIQITVFFLRYKKNIILFVCSIYSMALHYYYPWLPHLDTQVPIKPSWLTKKKRKKQQKKNYIHTRRSIETHTKWTFTKNPRKNQTTFVVFVCDGHSELSLPPISNCLSILQNIFFYCARVSKLLLTHSRCWNITHTHRHTHSDDGV